MKVTEISVSEIKLPALLSEDDALSIMIHVDLIIEDDNNNRTSIGLAVTLPYDTKETVESIVSKAIGGARQQLLTASSLPLEEWTRLHLASLEYQEPQ